MRAARKRAEGSVAVAEAEAEADGEEAVAPESGQPGPPETRWSLWGDLEG